MFISTHILPEVQKMNADSIGIIDHGHLIMEGTINELDTRLGSKKIRILPNHEVFQEALQAYKPQVEEERTRSLSKLMIEKSMARIIADVSLKQKIPVTEFRATGLEIEQIFMKALESEKSVQGGKFK